MPLITPSTSLSSFPLSTPLSSAFPQPPNGKSNSFSSHSPGERPSISGIRRFSAPLIIFTKTNYPIPRHPGQVKDSKVKDRPKGNRRHSITPLISVSKLTPLVPLLRSPSQPTKTPKAVIKNSVHSPPSPQNPRTYRQQQFESRCMQLVAPGFYVAFEDDVRAYEDTIQMDSDSDNVLPWTTEGLTTREGMPFTHIISLSHRPNSSRPKRPSQRISIDPQSGIKYLHLSLPPIPPYGSHKFEKDLMDLGLKLTDHCPILTHDRERYFRDIHLIEEKGIPMLHPDQFTLAKQFIQDTKYSFTSTLFPPPVRILITTPRDDRASAMALALVYLSSCSGRRVGDILDWMNDKAGFLSVWRDVVGYEWVKDLQQLAWHYNKL